LNNQVFLIDNAESMRPFWSEVTFLLPILVLKAKHQDPDGPDFFFTCSKDNLRKTEDVRKVQRKLKEAAPRDNVKTDMAASLLTLFEDYFRRWRMYNSGQTNIEPRFETIIVLTDGLWEGMRHSQRVLEEVRNFYGNFKKTVGRDLDAKTRELSIQFVQFGNNANAEARLRRLDDGMGNDGIP
jgi:hypothetical protein